MYRRLIVAVLILALGGSTAAQAHEASRWANRTGHYQGLDQGHWTKHEVRHLIRWATNRMTVRGGLNEALYVASHESGLRHDAQNPYSSASGVYQTLRSTFDSWYDRFARLRRRLDLRDHIFNARTNVILSIRAATNSWCPWRATSHYC